MLLYFLLIITLFLYIFLIHNFLNGRSYNTKIVIALSISILFILIYENIRNNEGYATTDKLPDKFYVLNTYTNQDNVLILIKEQDQEPRLYRIKKSIELNKFLRKYNGLKKDGQDVVVRKRSPNNKDALGMYIESVQKKLPPK